MTTLDSRIMEYVVRMVVPMRREFGCSLDVQHFLHDPAYAREVLGQAQRSRDQRLRAYASRVELALGGRQGAQLPPAPEAPLDGAGAGSADDAGTDEAELKASMLRKYTGGLR
jgi:hypothetical protein